MTTSNTRRAWLAALLLVPAGTIAFSRAPAPPVEGWTFTWNVTTDAGPQQNSTMQVRLVSDRMRIDILKGATPGMPPGGYMIINAAKGEMFMVSPQEKAATLIPLAGMGQATGQMAAQSGMKMEATDISVSVDDLGAGEPILGHATHKYRIQQNFTLNMTMAAMGVQHSTRTESSTETWMATDIPEADLRAFDTFSKTFGQSAGGISAIGGEGLEKLKREVEAKTPKGFPLKQVATATMTIQGRPQTSRTTAEVTNMSKASIEPSIFEVPSGYNIKDMSKMLQDATKKPPQ